MVCRQCGTEIAEKAIICYKCGTATARPEANPSRRRGRSSGAHKTVWVWVGILVAVAAGVWWYVR